MPRTLFHLEFVTKNGDERIIKHSYYTSLTALYEDNEEIEISLQKLQTDFSRKKLEVVTHSGHWFEWTIRKANAWTASEVRGFNTE